MSNVILNTLKRELKRKQKRIDELEKLMSERHLNSEDAKAMDSFAEKFNNAKSADEKIKIANEWSKVTERWQQNVDKAKHQSDNYVKWMDKQHELMSECRDLSNEIAQIEFRESMRKGGER